MKEIFQIKPMLNQERAGLRFKTKLLLLINKPMVQTMENSPKV